RPRRGDDDLHRPPGAGPRHGPGDPGSAGPRRRRGRGDLLHGGHRRPHLPVRHRHRRLEPRGADAVRAAGRDVLARPGAPRRGFRPGRDRPHPRRGGDDRQDGRDRPADLPRRPLHAPRAGRGPPAIELFAQLLLTGVVAGGNYALLAVGYTLVYGVLGFINFAHGDVAMIGAYVALLLASSAGWPLPAAVLGAMAAAA